MGNLRLIHLDKDGKPVIRIGNIRIGEVFFIEEYPNIMFFRVDEGRIFGVSGQMYKIEDEE